MRPFNDSIQGDEGDRWFISWLERNGFTDVKRTDQYCRWDKDKICDIRRSYYQENKDRICEQHKEYRKKKIQNNV